MLLVPIEDRGSWRRPPVLIVLLFLLNLVIHLHTQTSYRSPERQLDHFLDDEQIRLLVEREWPLFLSWIEEDQPELALRVRDSDTEQRRRILENRAWYRGDFSRHIRQSWQDNTPSPRWRQAREQVQAWRAKQPAIAYGLVPAEVNATSLITHMFMHGGWAHLFGNMLFLFLFGVPMERHWGIRRLALMYLLSGLGAAGLFIAFHPNSYTPLVGASGAIAGLMGIYATSYGLRRIEFFYTLGFVFGSFRAPAFAVFPLWIGMELIQDLALDTNVAYMAHVGGLLTGAGVTLVLQRLWPSAALDQVDEQGSSPRPDSQQAHQANTIPLSIEKQVRSFNFDQGLELALRRLEEHPDWPELWRYAMELAPRGEPRHQQSLLQLAARKRHAGAIDASIAARLWQHAQRWDAQARALSPAGLVIMAESLLDQGMTSESRALVDQLSADGFNHPRLEHLRQQVNGPSGSPTA